MSPVPPAFALILAAGRGIRFGGDKLMAPLAGRAVLGRVLDTVTASARDGILRAVYMVTRNETGPEASLAREAGAIVVVAERAGEGLALRLRAALDRVASSAPSGGASALIVLGDQPGLRRDVIAEVVRRWRATSAVAVRPEYAGSPGEPGHPVLLDRRIWPEAARLEGDAGLGGFLRSRGVELVQVPGRNPDIDTPADLAEFPLEENA
jgi:molybdenum cofactor cytidylyltransferase